MKKNTTHHSGADKHQTRRGTVPVELALFLPTYAAMIMVLFTIFSFARTRGEVAVETRHEAWMKRKTPGKETLALPVSSGEAEQVGRILNHEQDPTLGLVSARHQKNATVYLKTLNLLTDIQLEHAVLTDTWDYRTIPFEEEQHHHRLQLGKRILAFGSIDRGAFGGLASATGGFSGQASGLQKSLNHDRDQATSRVNQAKESVSREISATQKMIHSLESEVKKLQKMFPLDEDLIQELQKKISDQTRKRVKLNQQLSHLNSASGYLESELTDSAATAE